MGPRLHALACLLALGLVASPALADEAKKDEDKKEGEKKDGEKKDGEKKDGEKKDGEKKKNDLDPKEDPNKAYFFAGVRWRQYVVPDFIFNLFADGGYTTSVFSIGGEFTYRKGGLELDISASYADYGLNDALFKGKNDGDFAWEIVKSNLKLANFEFDLLFDFPVDKEGRFSFLVGGGVGFGIVAGDLRRNQAYPNTNPISKTDASKWTKCAAVGNPNAQYCDGGNGHYGDYQEPDWIKGGSLPVVFPVLTLPQFSFRIKPIKQLAIRIDSGFSISGFFGGLAAAYGF